MRVCKRQMKGKIVFALLLAMLVTLVWPVSSYADELGDGTAADTVEKDAENGSDESVDAGDDSVPETEDEPESEDKDEAETDGKDSEPEESGNQSDVQTDELEEKVSGSKKELEQNESKMDSKLELASVVLDKNGQKIKKGEKLEITIGVANESDVELPESGKVIFAAAASDECEPVEVTLTLGEDFKYHGSLTTEDMYPCEWYIDYIKIGQVWTNNEFPDKGTDPYYVYIYDGDTYDDSAFDVNIVFSALDEKGNYYTVGEVKKENVQRRQSLKEVGVTFPEMKSDYEGLTQIGWKEEGGRIEVTENTQFFELSEHSGTVNIIAQYDKSFIRARYIYPGRKSIVDRLFLYEPDDLFGDVLKKIKEFVPEDFSKEYTFIGWECDASYGENNVIPDQISDTIFVRAKLAEGSWIELIYEYYDQNGIEVRDSDIRIVEEGISYITGVNMLMEAGAPQLYEGLKFRCWFYPITFDYPMKNGDGCYTWAMYDNFLIRYVINTGDEERIFCQVADRGETVDTMTTFEGLGEVTWDEGKAPGETYDVPVHIMNNSVTFSGSAEVIEKPAEPSKPSNPSTPSGSTSGSTSGDIKYPDKNLGTVVGEINSSTPGQTVQLNMNSWTSVPTEILEAAKGKDVNVVLVMDGYSWTINGKDIQTIYNRDRTDLKVTKNTNNIPGSTVTAVAGDNPSLQISLAHEGDFGFKATLSIGVGSEHAGKYGNLYYHDKNGKLVFIDAGQIDSEGNVSLVFSHASDYLLVISDQAMSQINVPENLKPAGTNQNGAASAVNTNSNVTTRSPKTGDYTAVYPWLLLCAAAAGYTMVYGSRRKRVQK